MIIRPPFAPRPNSAIERSISAALSTPASQGFVPLYKIGILARTKPGGFAPAATTGYLMASVLPMPRTNGAIAMSMQSVASPAIPLTPPKRNSLTHIPGDEGWPLIGKTLQVLADPKGQVERQAAKYGLVYRSHLFGETSLVLLGPEANELVLFDQAKLFSSTHGWGRILGLLFPRGLMLLDFHEHRLHRRALSVAFKSGPMRSEE